MNDVEDGVTTWSRGFVCRLNSGRTSPWRSIYQAACAPLLNIFSKL